MAEIVGSLFGITADQYERDLARQDQARAIQMAGLEPGVRGAAMIQYGASQLGRGIGSLLGGQDPQLQLISARNQIARQIDPSNPESFMSAAQRLAQMGDMQGANALADAGRKAQAELALVGQRNAAAQASIAQATRERAPPTTNEITNARAVALRAGPEGSPAYNTAFNAKIDELTTKPGEKPLAPNIKEIGVAEKSRAPVYLDVNNNEQFTFGMGPDGKQVRVPFTGGVDRTTAKTTVDARPPGERVPVKDWMDFSTKILSGDPTMVRTNTIISDAPSAIETIRTSATNDISAASLPSALAQLTGQGKNMSNQDVNRFARTGGLDDRLAQDAVKFFTGSTTKVKKDQAEKFATALYRGALIEQKARLQNQAEQFGYTDSPNYKIALQQIDGQLAKFKLAPKPGTTNATAPAQAGKLSDADLRKKYGVPE